MIVWKYGFVLFVVLGGARDGCVRRFIHGTSRIDERAVLIEGHLGDPNPVAGNATAEGYYYLLQELDSVPALMRQNGALGEANVYSAYGRVRTFGYSRSDINRDGNTTSADYVAFGAYGPSGFATNDPTLDYDFDGDKDFYDWGALHASGQPSADEPIPSSGVGNPYAFTGRRLVRYESLPDDDDSRRIGIRSECSLTLPSWLHPLGVVRHALMRE